MGGIVGKLLNTPLTHLVSDFLKQICIGQIGIINRCGGFQNAANTNNKRLDLGWVELLTFGLYLKTDNHTSGLRVWSIMANAVICVFIDTHRTYVNVPTKPIREVVKQVHISETFDFNFQMNKIQILTISFFNSNNVKFIRRVWGLHPSNEFYWLFWNEHRWWWLRFWI